MGFRETLQAAVAPGPDRRIPGAVVMAADASGSDFWFPAHRVITTNRFQRENHLLTG